MSTSTNLTDLAPLFEPTRINGLELRNRFAMAPMTRRTSPDGVPGPAVAAYYARRAAGEVALILTEGIFIPHPTAGTDIAIPRIATAEQIAGWRAVTSAVHSEGGAILAQLWHQGVQRKPDSNLAPWSPSGLDLHENVVGKPMTRADIDDVLEAYVRASENARDAGFDGVEVHGAHGYLPDSFLWRRTNQRTDDFGGRARARAKFPAMIVAAIRAELGDSFPIVYRYSQWKNDVWSARNAESPDELDELLTPIAAAGADAFHTSTRRYFLPAFVELSGPDGKLGLAGWVKRITGRPVITVGSVGLDNEFDSAFDPQSRSSLTSLNPLVERFGKGEFDMVAVGRSLLGDPEWVRKLHAGRFSEIEVFTPAHKELYR